MKRRLAPWALRDRDGHPQYERENRTSRSELRLAAERLPANVRHATARMLRLLVLPALLATIGTASVAAAERYGHLDSLSMRAEQLKQVSENVEYGQGPEKLGAAEPFVRFLETEAYVDFELACDPEKQTYLTVRVWGSSGSGGRGLPEGETPASVCARVSVAMGRGSAGGGAAAATEARCRREVRNALRAREAGDGRPPKSR